MGWRSHHRISYKKRAPGSHCATNSKQGCCTSQCHRQIHYQGHHVMFHRMSIFENSDRIFWKHYFPLENRRMEILELFSILFQLCQRVYLNNCAIPWCARLMKNDSVCWKLTLEVWAVGPSWGLWEKGLFETTLLGLWGPPSVSSLCPNFCFA